MAKAGAVGGGGGIGMGYWGWDGMLGLAGGGGEGFWWGGDVLGAGGGGAFEGVGWVVGVGQALVQAVQQTPNFGVKRSGPCSAKILLKEMIYGSSRDSQGPAGLGWG